jgi:hypothetical protein
MPNLVVSAVAKWNGTALKKGERQLTQFQKTTNALAKSFAAAFAVRKIVQFGKASVQAFAADEKAAKSLSIALQNTGNGFAQISTEGFIARMQDTYKVLDDELRPAFQTLLTATGSITKAQEGLQLALDVSAGTTKDLASVSSALAKGYSGQTTALSRLGAGLDKATIKSGDMDKILAVLSARFSGQALGSLDTYAKKMDALSVAAANSKEIIGKGLLDSISALGSADGITKATTEMEKFAQSSADALLGLSTLLGRLKGSGVGTAVSGAFSSFMNSGLLAKIGREQRLKNAPYSSTSMYFTAETAERAKLIATIKKGNAVEKEKNKLTAAEVADKKKQAELDALKKKFDVERINLETALLNSKDEAEKARIRSLLTIMDEDANAAAKRMAELDKANAARLNQEYLAAISLGNLSEAAKLAAMGVREIKLAGVPLSQYETYKDAPIFQKAIEIESQLVANNAAAAAAEAEAAAAAAEVIASNSEAILAEYLATISRLSPQLPGVNSGAVNNITINTPLGSEDALTEAVQKAVQQLNRYGYSQTYAGALPTP